MKLNNAQIFFNIKKKIALQKETESYLYL